MNLSKTLRALYVVNKNAKQFATAASSAYTSDNHSTADMNSERKEALYLVKANTLLQVYPQADVIAEHEIDGSTYYYFVFEDGSNTWKFHIPTNEVPVDSSQVEEKETLQDFSTDESVTGVSMTLKEALKTINSEAGVNANEYLPPGNDSHKWPFLY